jgi:hypothetical protein
MKKLLFLAAGALVLTANLSSCKKGENDPFLSLKSRKARVTGEWTVTKMESTYSNVNSEDPSLNSSGTSSYNGTTATSTYTYDGNTTAQDPETYTQTFTFEKDGTFSMIYAAGTASYTVEGNWIFLGKNKNAELGKKEAIMLTTTKETYSEAGDSQTESFTGYQNTMTFLIDQLKSKEMILIDESTNVDGVETSTDKSTYTLTAK